MIIEAMLAAFTLVGAEKSATVVIPENADESTKLCVEELTNYVCRITGKELEVRVGVRERNNKKRHLQNLHGGMGGTRSVASAADTEVGPPEVLQVPQNSIVIGTLTTLGDAVPEVAREALAKARQYEAAWTGTVDGNLWIVGKESVAELYATYHFLETKLGVRWFQAAVPEDPGDYYPIVKIEPCRGGEGVEGQGLVVLDFQEFREPDFEFRRLNMCSAYWYQVPKAGKACAVRNGFQTPDCHDFFKPWPQYPDFYNFYMPRQSRRLYEVGGGHVMFTHVAPESTFEKHPDWFALQKGKRVKGHQYCFSSEGLLRATADYAIRRMKANGGKGIYLFGQADLTYGWCECDRCRAMDPPGTDYESSGPNISTRLYKMSEKVAKMIRAEVPEADLHLWAYNTYRELPVGVTPDPTLKLQFCDHGRCYGHHLDDPKCVRNVEMLALMKKWLAVIPRMYTYEYFACTPPFYICHEHDEAHDLRLYKSLGMIGWSNEGYFTGSKFVGSPDTCETYQSNWQWAYVTGHLLWDVNRDVDALLDDAETKYYGVAAPAMKKYHAYRRKLWADNKGCMGYPMDDPKRPTMLNTPGAKEKLLDFLSEAEKLVQVESPSPRKDDRFHSSTSTSNFDSAVLRHRLSRDRKWLDKYWIKPNEHLAELAKNAIRVPEMKGTVTVDGVGDDEAWKTAPVVSDFRKTCKNKKGEIPPIPEALRTEVRVLRDASNFYFLFTAMEPQPDKMLLRPGHDKDNWNGDGLEFMLVPPAVDMRYYQIASTAAGDCYDASHPGGVVADDYDVLSVGKVLKDRYVIEMRVPVKKMHGFKPGETWRILFARNRSITDEICPNHWDHNFSVGGCGYHDTSSFTPVNIE